MEHAQTRREFLKLGLLAVPGAFSATGSFAALTEFSLPPVDLEMISSKMKLTRRWEWSQTMPKTSRLREAGSFDRLTVHHSGGLVESGESADAVIVHLNGIIVEHAERGYGDIGYHFVIDRAGRAWEGRSLGYEGAHVYGENERNIGIVLLGNFEVQQPSKEQIAAMDQITLLLCERYRIKHHRVYGHRDLAASVCPGKHLYSYAQKLKA